MKGIIMAGGKGSRLLPSTKVLSKHLMPVYDKSMIYYPLSLLLDAGIKDIIIIGKPEDIESYMHLFSNGEHLGIRIEYSIQKEAKGIADAYIVANDLIAGDHSVLVLGDNILYNHGLGSLMKKAMQNNIGASIFACHVSNPSSFGVIEIKDGKAISIEEKPEKPKSNYAIPGIYFFDSSAFDKAKSLKPSKRKELEISDLLKLYMREDRLSVLVENDLIFFDAGTPDGLLRASSFVFEKQKSGEYLACLEEIAFQNGYISKEELMKIGKEMKDTEYGKHIFSVLEKAGYDR